MSTKLADSYHFIGIGGVGMSGLARLLLQEKLTVSGSDLACNDITERLKNEGATIYQGHTPVNINEKMTVIYTTGVDQNNPEYQAALQLKCSLLHRSDLLSQLMAKHRSLAVAGSHGKTSTSALLATVLFHAGLDPSFAIGGILPEFQTNARKGQGEYFVAEACESDGTLTKYCAFGGIVTNINFDHLSFFGSQEKLIAAFQRFILQITHTEHFFWCGDDLYLRQLALPGYSYGCSADCDLQISRVRQIGWSLFFTLVFQDKTYTDIALPLIGEHNVLNAAAVFGLCLTLGLSEENIRKGFLAFKGVGRRAEKKGVVRQVLVVDDYAHHTTEIQTTLAGIRTAIGARRLLVVFQPHRYTRTKECLGAFSQAFSAADEVIVTDIYAAQEKPIASINSQSVVAEIASNFRLKACYVPHKDLLQAIAEKVRPHDVVVTLGAGNITRFSQELIEHLQAFPPAKWKVAIIFGGQSAEHKISLLSARYVIDSLDDELYEKALFGIQEDGMWVEGEALFSGEPPLKAEHRFSKDILQRLQACEILFPICHGPNAEDGTLQGFFDILGKAYVGCDHRSSAICMDKALTKQIAALQGINVIPSVSIRESQWLKHKAHYLQQINERLTYPLFVKPSHLGSTLGITKVNHPHELFAAIESAFKVDTDVLVENGLNVREIEFAVIGNEEPRVFPPGEILTNGKVYDYQGKYDSTAPVQVTVEAVLPEEILQQGMSLAKQIYQAIHCQGMSRVDFFLDDQQVLWLNEINPIPGFTKNSLYPKICALHGIEANKLIDELLILALDRKRRQSRTVERVT